MTDPHAAPGLPTRAFALFTTRCNRRTCGRVFIGAGAVCEKCERTRQLVNARRDLNAGIRESLGVQPIRVEPKPKRACTISEAERQRRRERARALNAVRR